MGWVCGTSEGGERCIQGFWWLDLRERDLLEDLGIDKRILLKWNSRKRDGGMDWIDLAQVRYRWLSVVKALMNSRGIAGVADDTVACPEGLLCLVNRFVLNCLHLFIYESLKWL